MPLNQVDDRIEASPIRECEFMPIIFSNSQSAGAEKENNNTNFVQAASDLTILRPLKDITEVSLGKRLAYCWKMLYNSCRL